MAEIKVLADSWTTVTAEEDPDDQYSGEDTDTDWTFNGIKLASKTEYPDLTTDFKPKTGKTYYLVLVTYDSDDSFSHNGNACVEYVDLYRDIDKATATRDEIIRHNNANNKWTDEKPYNLVLTLDNGKDLEYPAPWLDYFSDLGEVRLVTVCL